MVRDLPRCVADRTRERARVSRGKRLAADARDGRTEIVTLSFWVSEDAIRAFAGDDIAQAVFYPDDDRYLVDREATVTHYAVVSGAT